jgi:hypothetical protein
LIGNQVRVDENGRVLDVLDRKPETRRIKIKQLTPDKDLAQMSEDIIEKCKFIHPSRKEELEQLLIKLRKYQLANPPKPEAAEPVEKEREDRTSSRDDGKEERKSSSKRRGDGDRDRDRDRGDRDRDRDREGRGRADQPAPSAAPEDNYPPASMDEVDDYLELLYQISGGKGDKDDGMESQVRGTAMILKLCRNVVNLEILIQNSTLMGALTRVLQEEFKKSSELTFNILRYHYT